jgi:hypothetical protein
MYAYWGCLKFDYPGIYGNFEPEPKLIGWFLSPLREQDTAGLLHTILVSSLTIFLGSLFCRGTLGV